VSNLLLFLRLTAQTLKGESAMSAVMVKTSQPAAPEATGLGDQRWSGLYSLGGILFGSAGIASVAASYMASRLYPSGMPGTAEAYLQLVSHNQALASGLWCLWIFLDFLLIAPTVALYLVLRRDNRVLALLGSLLSMFFVFYDISVTELNSLTLVSLSHGYASTTDAVLKASYVTAATYGYTALPLQTVLSFGIGSVGYLLWSIVMLQGRIFPRWAAILGIIMGGMGIVGAASPVIAGSVILGICQYLSIPFMGLWFIIIGVRLHRYGRGPTFSNEG
jgi:hypothetical protein